MQSKEKHLTDKQQRFIEEYCIDFNATQAAIRAGYSEKTAHDIGCENLKKPNIAASIKNRLDDLAMSAGEALKRLGDMARGSLSHFTNDDNSGIDLESEYAKANFHLIKELESTEVYGDEHNKVLKTKIKIHDAQAALINILKMHGKFIEKIDITTLGERIPSSFNINIKGDGKDG